MTEPKAAQRDKFKQPTRELVADDDLERFKQKLGTLVTPKLVEKRE